MASRYAAQVPELLRDIHKYLIEQLQLPTTFRSSDPVIGEAYGLLAAQNLSDIDHLSMGLDCIFQASSAFATYWEAQTWGVSTALNLDHLTYKVPNGVDRRNLLATFQKSGSITVGAPRSPLRSPESQTPHIWIVDLMMPCRIQLLIQRDETCGHQ